MKKILIITSIVIGGLLLESCVVSTIFSSKLEKNIEEAFITKNIINAKQLFMISLGHGGAKSYKDLPNHELYRFKTSTGEDDWLYSPQGFGECKSARTNGQNVKIILISPKSITNKFVVCSESGAVFTVTYEEIKDMSGLPRLEKQ